MSRLDPRKKTLEQKGSETINRKGKNRERSALLRLKSNGLKGYVWDHSPGARPKRKVQKKKKKEGGGEKPFHRQKIGSGAGGPAD